MIRLKNVYKSAVVLVCISIALLAFTSCGTDTEVVKQEVEQNFIGTMEAFKSGDVEKIKVYYDSIEVSDDTELRNAILSSLDNVQYNIDSITVINDKRANVVADITLIDASQVMQKYIDNIATMVSSKEYQEKVSSMTKEDYQELMDSQLMNVLQSGEIPDTTKTIEVEMKKTGDNWKVVGSALPDLLITNTLNAINQIK